MISIMQSATTYFNKLGELLVNTTVTDQEGNVLPLDEGADRAVELVLEAVAAQAKVMVMGNGGSAAIASHLHNDLCKAVGVRSMVFNEPPLLTALANDHGYGCVFERPVDMWAEKNDVMVAISSSGCSENILRAARAAVERECSVITLSGFKQDNPLRHFGNLNFYVIAEMYGLVEVAHSALVHYLADAAMVRTAKSDSQC